jgi:5'-3' exonuclease
MTAVLEHDTEAPATTEIALIDLSSIAYPIWHMSGAQPDVDYTSTQIVARIRSLTATHPKAAICCDKGKSFRHALAPSYKANRPEREAALHHQIKLAIEQLQSDGYPVWAVDGFEADDLIATATSIALGLADVTVLVLSADKDLLQLVGPRVRAMSVTNGNVYDEAAVVAKYGVTPAQMRDYLTLVGDASDNIKGAQGIGPKKAAELLARYGTLSSIYSNLSTHGTQFKPAMATALREFEPRLKETLALVSLRADAEIPFVELDTERTPKDVASMEDTVTEIPDGDGVETYHGPAVAVVELPRNDVAAPKTENGHAQPSHGVPSQALVVREPDVLAPAPAEWERQLEPRSIREAQALAKFMYDSRLFAGYGTPAAVLSTVLAGRELGLQAIASLRGIHVVEGRHMLAADLLRALVLRSGLAKYFRCRERTPERATFETWRKDEPEAIALTYTIEDGKAAWGKTEDAWTKSGWGRNPADMLVARAGSKLARLVYPEVVHGLYTPEEFD